MASVVSGFVGILDHMCFCWSSMLMLIFAIRKTVPYILLLKPQTQNLCWTLVFAGGGGRFSYVNRPVHNKCLQIQSNMAGHSAFVRRGAGCLEIHQNERAAKGPTFWCRVDSFWKRGCCDSKGMFWVRGASLGTVSVCMESKGVSVCRYLTKCWGNNDNLCKPRKK